MSPYLQINPDGILIGQTGDTPGRLMPDSSLRNPGVLGLLILIVCFFSPVTGLADTLALNTFGTLKDLARHVELLEDPAGRWDVDTVRAFDRTHWVVDTRERVLQLGYSTSVWWVRFELTNPGKVSASRILDVAWPLLNYLDVYVYEGQKKLGTVLTGDQRPFADRPLSGRTFAIPLQVDPGHHQTVLLRMAMRSGIFFAVPLKLWLKTDFDEQLKLEGLIQGVYLGALLALLLYNGVLYLSIRHDSLLFYALYLAGFGLWNIGFQGVGMAYFWQDAAWFNRLFNLLMPCLLHGFSSLFVVSYLETRQRAPRLHRLIQMSTGSILVIIAPALLNQVYPGFPIVAPAYLFTIMSNLLMMLYMVAGFWLMRCHFTPARYFVLACSCLFLGSIVYRTTQFPGLDIPDHLLIENSINVGSALEFLLLAWAVGDRFSRIRDEKQAAEQQGYRLMAEIVAHEQYEGEILKAKAAAERLAETRTLFLANMSHEIRTPMNAVLGFLQLLQQTELSVRQLDYTSKARTAAESLLNILNDILNFTKIESGKLDLERVPFRLDDGLRNLSVILVSSSRNKNLDILFDISPDLPDNLIGDPLRLHQVLLNLSSNAVKFTEQGQVIIALQDVLTTDQEVSIAFSISDTGIGIPEEKRLAIFEGFNQAESSTTRHHGGAGLGLAISQRLVKLMGGELSVSSQPGVGSCFSFTLTFPYSPVKVADQTDSAVRVLVVDDNPLAIASFCKLARRMGWQVDAVASGQAALGQLASPVGGDIAYQAIFIDQKMTPLDGLTTLGAIRQIRPFTPLILMGNPPAYEGQDIPKPNQPDAFLPRPATGSMLQEAYTEANSQVSTLGSPVVKPGHRQESLAGLRLLLVEDNPFNQQVASELLSRNGAEVEMANNGLEGVEKALAHAYDAILMDVQMPVMDGYEATRQIRQKGKPGQVIIAMTANAFESDREACLAVGMNAHIGKPFLIDNLLQVIQTARQPSGANDTDLPMRQPDIPAASPLDLPVFAMDMALGLMDQDRELLTELIRLFWAAYPEQRASLGAAMISGDGVQGADIAHALKGNAGYFSALELKDCTTRMELLCRNNQMDAANRCLAEFDGAVERFRQACIEHGLAVAVPESG